MKIGPSPEEFAALVKDAARFEVVRLEPNLAVIKAIDADGNEIERVEHRSGFVKPIMMSAWRENGLRIYDTFWDSRDAKKWIARQRDRGYYFFRTEITVDRLVVSVREFALAKKDRK